MSNMIITQILALCTLEFISSSPQCNNASIIMSTVKSINKII